MKGCRRSTLIAWVLTILVVDVATASAQTVTTIRANGSPANRVDLVVLGDGYTQDELVKFGSDVEAFIQSLFAAAPFAEYRNYFNVHRVDVISAESGADHPSRSPPVFKNTALDGTFDCNGIQRLTCVNLSKVNTVLSGVQPDMRDLVLVILNDPEYGGSGGAVAVTSTHTAAVEIILHELGHTLGLLADEYGGPPPPVCNNTFEPPEVNATRAAGGPIKWGVWIAPGTPLPTQAPTPGLVGLYEGAKYCDVGLFRPTFGSKMRILGAPFEQINTEQLIKRIYNWTSPIDGAVPTSSSLTLPRDQSQTLQVVTTQPLTHVLGVVWTVDGVVVAGTGPALVLNGASLTLGPHVVAATVSDLTPLVRNDPSELLRDVVQWSVTVVGGSGGGATATFVRNDATTQGTWQGVYGSHGAAVFGDTANYPAYAQVSTSGAAPHTWEATTTDGRALQRITNGTRVAATLYGDVMNIDVNLTDGQPHRLALYSVDWDQLGRSQRVDVRDAATGALLDSQTLTAFGGGQYLVWQVTGHVVIQVTRLAGVNAVISGFFFDPLTTGGGGATATFVRTDATTQGTWQGVYGSDGAAVIGDTANYPAYAQVSSSGAAPHTWEATTTDGRALQRITNGTRVAATLYGDVMNIDVNLTDGQPHRLALYSVDWDQLGRSQRVDVRDAATGALLDSQTLTAFGGGQYLVWQLTGHVVIQVTRLGDINAVISGLFFDPLTTGGGGATATFVRNDATTQGTWQGVYGSHGAAVIGDTANYPAYAQVSSSGAAPHTWEATTTDGRALQRITDATRVAATLYGDVMNIDVNLTDGQPHQLALYSVDWDQLGRSQRVDVRDAATGALLDSQTLTAFGGGQYLVWQVTGHVVIQVTRLAGVNAVISGLFFDPLTTGGGGATATFVRTDATTQGTWQGVYGSDGAAVIGDTANYPAYAQVSSSGAAPHTWEATTTDGRALQRITNATRLAATLYGDVMNIDVNLTDGQPHRLALYSVDWDQLGRSQRVDVRDAVTGALLNSQTLTAFGGGQYLVWQLTGHVVIQVTRLNDINAVISGLFFDSGSASPPKALANQSATSSFISRSALRR